MTASQGQPFRPSARAWNSFGRAADWVAMQQSLPSDQTRGAWHPPGLVLIKNTTGGDIDRGGVLGISGSMFDPAESLEGFRESVPFLTGTTPAASNHKGKFVVCLEAIPAGGSGYAIAAGVVRVKVNVTTEGIGRCEVKNGDATQLQTDADGSSKILTIEAGTGTKWATVRIADAPPIVSGPQLWWANVASGTIGGSAAELALTEIAAIGDAFTADETGCVLNPAGIYRCAYSLRLTATRSSYSAFTEFNIEVQPNKNDAAISAARNYVAVMLPEYYVNRTLTIVGDFTFLAAANDSFTLKILGSQAADGDYPADLGVTGGGVSQLTLEYVGVPNP